MIKKYKFTSIGYDLGYSGTDSYPVLHMMDLQSDEIYMVNVDNDTKNYEKKQTSEAIVVDCSTLLGETSLRELKEYWYDEVKYTNIEKITERTSIVRINKKEKSRIKLSSIKLKILRVRRTSRCKMSYILKLLH